AQAGVDFAVASALANDFLELGIRSRSNAQAHTVIRENVEFENVIHRAACQDRMHAAGIVADHPAQIAVLVRRRIGSKSEIELVRALAQMIKHHAGLHPRVFLLWIEFQDLIEIFGKINDDSNVATLSGEAGATTACQNRSAITAGKRQRLDYIINCFGNYNADRDLAIVGPIIGIERAAPLIKPSLATDAAAQVFCQGFRAIARELVA